MSMRSLHRWTVQFLLGALLYQTGACPCGCWDHSLWSLIVDHAVQGVRDLSIATRPSTVVTGASSNSDSDVASQPAAASDRLQVAKRSEAFNVTARVSQRKSASPHHDHHDSTCHEAFRAPMTRPDARPVLEPAPCRLTSVCHLIKALLAVSLGDRSQEYVRFQGHGWGLRLAQSPQGARHTAVLLQTFLC